MPIEFNCPECQRLLRVPDESAGAQAKCPQCGAITTVPAVGQSEASEPVGPPPTSPMESSPFGENTANPYATPVSDPQAPAPKAVSGEVVPTEADIGQVLSYAFEVWKQNLGLLVGVTAVVFGINFGFGIVQVIGELALEDAGEEAAALLGLVINVASNLVGIYLGIGQAKIALKLLRDQPAEFGDLFSGGSLFPRTLGASILAGIAITAGVLACVIPGIAMMILFWPFYWLIVDEKADAIESFSMALPLGRVNVGTTLVVWLATVGVMILGVLALCIGILFAFPLTTLMWGTAYLMMSGQLGNSQA